MKFVIRETKFQYVFVKNKLQGSESVDNMAKLLGISRKAVLNRFKKELQQIAIQVLQKVF